jgi:hypothetical protein
MPGFPAKRLWFRLIQTNFANRILLINKNMITIIDTIRYSEEHAPFNAAFSTILHKTYSDQSIDVYFQSDHIENVSRILEKNSIPLNSFNFHKTYVFFHQNKSIKIFICYLISLVQDLRLIIKAKRGLIFYTSANPFSLYFIKLTNLILGKKIHIVLHGELEYLNKDNDKAHRFPNSLMRKWYRVVFWKLLNNNVRYIVLGENIFKNIKKIKTNNLPEDSFIIIDHPYFYPEYKAIHSNLMDKSQALCVGTIGHTAVAKNSHKIFELAELMAGSIAENKITFKIIGNISKCMSPYINKHVKIQSKKSFMPRTLYEEEIESLTYIVFFYSDSQYQFIASGVFFDAIAFEKPIVALRNSFFEYYFGKYNDIGFLCENLDEMRTVLENFNPDKYQNQIKNIRLLKEDLSLDTIADNLCLQISK